MKKLLSMLLVMTMIITSVSVFATDEATITTYITVSKYGEFCETTDGKPAVFLPVELTGKPEYTLDDLFLQAHEIYYGNTDGYSSAVSEYGAYVTEFWGDESGNFGYQINGGEVFVSGLTHPLENGDFVDFAIYKNMYPLTEAYTKFDITTAEIIMGESVELTLYEAGYDENWNTVFSPCADAVITINGEDTENYTDENGAVYIEFPQAGTYIISAHKEKLSGEKTIPAITAPVCVVTVKEPEYLTLLNNIAKKYSESKIYSDTNMVWLLADIAVYNQLYPENEIVFSDRVKQKCIDLIIEDCENTKTPSALAKNIIALKAMGYDGRNVYNSKSKKLDIVQKLTDMVDEENPAVTNIYTLPYVIIALNQSEDYATAEQMEYLLNSAISSKDLWQNNEWGTDAASAMLLALAPYYNTNDEVKVITDEALNIIISAQEENGLTGNAASTGIAITAVSALGIEPQTVICNENSLIDGLITQSTDDLDGFEPMENSFSTEQGFRGLLAWQLAKTGTIMYDFSSYPAEEVRSTKKSSGGSSSGGGSSYKPVTTPKEEPEKEPEAPTVVEKESIVKVPNVAYPEKTFNDVKKHINQNEIEELAKRGIVNGMDTNNYAPDKTMTRAEFATIITRALGLSEGSKTTFTDVTADKWYYTYVNIAYHYGIVNGVSDTQFNPDGVITRQEAAVMVTRGAKLCGMDTEFNETSTRDILSQFTDYITIDGWAKKQMAFCYENGIISDKNIEALPKHQITRAEVATMVYNTLKASGLLLEDTDEKTQK